MGQMISTGNLGQVAARGGAKNGWKCEGRPRILHLLLSPFRGGIEEHALSLLSALRPNGFSPFIAAPAPLLEAMAPELAEVGATGLTIPEPRSPFNWPSLAARLGAMFRRERIALIHGHSAIASICASLMAHRFGVRCIETCHNPEWWREKKPLKGSFWLDRQAGRFVDRFIAVCHENVKHLCETKGIPREKITVIHNGRDLMSLRPPTPEESAEARAELGVSNQQTILMLARLAEEKRHAVLIDALKILGSQSSSVIVLFAGVGPLQAELAAMCDAAGLTHQVRFLGYRTDVQKLLAAADLVVLPSNNEGLPLAAIEALAAARPLVATEVGGTPELVINGQTGLLIPPNDPDALAQAIRRVLGDPALALRLGTDGRLLVERHFDVRVQIERTMALYRDLTNGVTTQSASA